MFKLKTHRLFISLAVLVLILSLALVGCNSQSQNADNQTQDEQKTVIKIGATPKPHAEMLEFVKPKLAEKGIDLQIKVFTEYQTINPSVVDGSLDANFFQHQPYLDDFNAAKNTNLVSIGKVHIEPMGIYSEKVSDIKEFKNGDQIVIPNDSTNGGRALLLLEKAGLIKLKEGAGISASVQDIAENPLNLTIRTADAAQVPRTLSDPKVAGAVINGNYALEIGLNPVKDAIFLEDKDSPYANIVATTPEKANDPGLKALVEALNSPEMKTFIEETYQGAVVPAF